MTCPVKNSMNRIYVKTDNSNVEFLIHCLIIYSIKNHCLSLRQIYNSIFQMLQDNFNSFLELCSK